MSAPPVSVVMAVLNGERFLAEAVDSILAQSFGDFDFVIVDDGSTDGTAAMLESYSRKDGRIRVDYQQHKGLVDALNRGCSLARGKYIARMDADDVAAPERLRRQWEFMEGHPEVAVVGGAVELMDSGGAVLGIRNEPCLSNAEIQSALLQRCALWHPTVLMRRAVVAAVGGYRKLTAAEDYDLWLRIADVHELANLPEVLLRYRLHPGQVSAAQCRRQILGAVAARTAAAARRSGQRDPLDLDREISVEGLREIGVSDGTVQSALATGYLTWIRNMCQSEEYAFAAGMGDALRSCDYSGVPRWVKAESFLWLATAYWHERSFARCFGSLCRAAAARPVSLARPVKAILERWQLRVRLDAA